MRSYSRLIAAAIAFSVPLLAAVAYLGANPWFGASDLSAFAFWNLPFASVAVLTGSRAHSWLAEQGSPRRFLVAAVLGAAIGLCWTLALSVGMGPWVGAFSVPILYLWVLGGIATVVAFAAMPALPRLEPRRIQKRSTWRLMLWLIGIPLGSVALVATLWLGSMYGSMYLWDRAEPELHCIPDGYVGPVIIIFNQADGAPARYVGNTRIYNVPPTGVLRSQFPPNAGWSKPDYVYVAQNGHTRPIVGGAPCEDSLPAQTIQACLMGQMLVSGRSGAEYDAYIVGPTGEQRRLYERGDSMVRAVIFGE